MNAVICSLFEGHHHYGVAVLVNSLYYQGYRGSVYIGYRGELPAWARAAKNNISLQWNEGKTLELIENFQIHFLPVDIDYHLTNYKPLFMLRLLEGAAKDADGMVYFDPDITIKCKWNFFDNWMTYGVALVQELISNPMPSSHPTRLGWVDVINKANKQTKRDLNYYFNAGFCGVSRRNIEFIKLWSDIIVIASKQYGLDRKKFISSSDRTQHFNIIDQDALNITAMCSDAPISEVGPDGMNFLPGAWIMSHAIGSPKPWNKSFILMSLKGNSPTRADRDFWAAADGPIKNFKRSYIKWKTLSMSVAGFIGRFYSRK